LADENAAAAAAVAAAAEKQAQAKSREQAKKEAKWLKERNQRLIAAKKVAGSWKK